MGVLPVRKYIVGAAPSQRDESARRKLKSHRAAPIKSLHVCRELRFHRGRYRVPAS